MATRMQQRRGTASQWTTANPILAAGEIGFESDTGQFKIGDGTNHWDDLIYFKNVEDTGFNAEDYVAVTLLGEPLGVATLDADGKLEPSQIPNIDEISQDAINAALTAGTGISKNYDDVANTLTLSVDTDVIATKQYVGDQVTALVDGAPAVLNTLNELAAAINDDEEFSVTVLNALAGKVDDSQLDALLEDTILPLDARVGTLEQLKQDKVSGVSDQEIGTLSDINTATTIQAQIDLKADAADLAGKANASHTHPLSDITDVSASASEVNILDGATVTTAELNHVSGVTSSIQDQIDDKANSIHSHAISDVTGLETSLNSKAPIASPTFTGTVSGITKAMVGLGNVDNTTDINKPISTATQAALDGKTDVGHGHVIADVTGLQTALNGKAASSHTHLLFEITDIEVDAAAINSLDGIQGNVQSQLDDKSDVGHTHVLSDVSDVTASFTEVNRLSGVTSNVQNQLDSKQDEITGAASTVVSTDLSASRAVVSNASGKLAASSVTSAELGHLSGVTSGIQSQLDGKSATGHTHTISDISGVTASVTEINFLVGVDSSIQDQIDGKAASSHTHPQSAITNLVSDLSSKANLSGATFSGNVEVPGMTVTGNLVVQGTTTTVDTTNYAIRDNMIYMNQAGMFAVTNAVGNGTTVTYTAPNHDFEAGDYIVVTGVTPSAYNIAGTSLLTINSVNGDNFVVTKSDTGSYVSGGMARGKSAANPDLGFAAGRTTASGYGHTGLFRDASDATYKFFDGYTPEPDESLFIDTAHASFALAPIEVSAVTTGDLSVSGTVSGISANDLDDVTVTSASAQDVLVHNGTGWVNRYVNAIPTKIGQGTVTSNNYNIVASDAGKIVEISNSSATTVTIPSNETFEVGTMIVVSQIGSGQINIVVQSPSTQTLNSTPGSKLRAQWSVATLLKRSANTWLVYGDLVA